MSHPIGLLRFKNTSNREIGVEASDISIIEPFEGTESRSRVVLKNTEERRSPENFATLADRYDALLRTRVAQPLVMPTMVNPCRTTPYED